MRVGHLPFKAHEEESRLVFAVLGVDDAITLGGRRIRFRSCAGDLEGFFLMVRNVVNESAQI